jgi:hypothetical protein
MKLFLNSCELIGEIEMITSSVVELALCAPFISDIFDKILSFLYDDFALVMLE